MDDLISEVVYDYSQEFPTGDHIWESSGITVGPSGNVLATAHSFIGEVDTFYAYMQMSIAQPLNAEWVPIPGTNTVVANYPKSASFSLKGLPPRAEVRICLRDAHVSAESVAAGIRVSLRSDAGGSGGSGGGTGGGGTGGGGNPSGGPTVVPV